MENTSTHFECEIENLWYGTIESEISNYFNMGCPDSSDLPIRIQEDSSGSYTLVCEGKSGKFRVSNCKLKNGKYQLSVTLVGSLSNKRR